MLGSGDERGRNRTDSIAVIFATATNSLRLLWLRYLLKEEHSMLILLVSYYAYAYPSSKGKLTQRNQKKLAADNILRSLISPIIAGVMIWKGAIFLLDGATGLADTYDILLRLLDFHW